MSSKVLIIDDEKDICFLISEIIQDEKYITESALNSSEALYQFKVFKPKTWIPFASFVYFSHEENFYMNKYNQHQ